MHIRCASAQGHVDPGKNVRAQGQLRRVQRVQRRVDGVEMLVQIASSRIEVTQSGHDFAACMMLLDEVHRCDTVAEGVVCFHFAQMQRRAVALLDPDRVSRLTIVAEIESCPQPAHSVPILPS